MNFVIFKDIRPPKTNKRFTKAGKVSDFSTRFTGTTTKYVFLVYSLTFTTKFWRVLYLLSGQVLSASLLIIGKVICYQISELELLK